MLGTLDLQRLAATLMPLAAFASLLPLRIYAAPFACLQGQLGSPSVCKNNCNPVIVGHFPEPAHFNITLEPAFERILLELALTQLRLFHVGENQSFLAHQVGDVQCDGIHSAVWTANSVLYVRGVLILEFFHALSAIQTELMIAFQYHILLRCLVAVQTDCCAIHFDKLRFRFILNALGLLLKLYNSNYHIATALEITGKTNANKVKDALTG